MLSIFSEMPPDRQSPFNDPVLWKICAGAFHRTCQIKVMRLTCGEQTIGFAAFRNDRPLGIRSLNRPLWVPLTYLCAEFTSFIYRPTYYALFWQALSRYFADSPDACLLHNLTDCDDQQLSQSIDSSTLVQTIANPICEHTSRPFPAILRKTSLRRHVKGIAQFGPLHTVHYPVLRDTEPYRRFVELHTERWGYRSVDSLFARPEHRQLYEDLLRNYSSDTQTGFQVLLTDVQVNNESIAMHIGFSWNHRFLYQVPAINLKYMMHWPGEVLFYSLFEYATDTGHICFDLGYGSEPYKARYSTATIEYRSRLLGKAEHSTDSQTSPLRTALRFARSKMSAVVRKSRTCLTPRDKLLIYSIPTGNAAHTETNEAKEHVLLLGYMEYVEFCRQHRAAGMAPKPLHFDRFKQDGKFCVLVSGERVLSWGWMLTSNKMFVSEIRAHVVASIPVTWLIDFFTPMSERQKGHYTRLLKELLQIASQLPIIYTTNRNVASQKGIADAGFVRIAEGGVRNRHGWVKSRSHTITFQCEDMEATG